MSPSAASELAPPDRRVQYHIDKYHDPHLAEIEGADKPVMVYSVWMKGEETCLFEADGRWWILMKQ